MGMRFFWGGEGGGRLLWCCPVIAPRECPYGPIAELGKARGTVTGIPDKAYLTALPLVQAPPQSLVFLTRRTLPPSPLCKHRPSQGR